MLSLLRKCLTRFTLCCFVTSVDFTACFETVGAVIIIFKTNNYCCPIPSKRWTDKGSGDFNRIPDVQGSSSAFCLYLESRSVSAAFLFAVILSSGYQFYWSWLFMHFTDQWGIRTFYWNFLVFWTDALQDSVSAHLQLANSLGLLSVCCFKSITLVLFTSFSLMIAHQLEIIFLIRSNHLRPLELRLSFFYLTCQHTGYIWNSSFLFWRVRIWNLIHW